MVVQDKFFRTSMVSSVFALLLGVSPIAIAQDGSASPQASEDVCQIVYEGIVPMRTPNFDQAAVWKRTFGVLGVDIPRALMKVADEGVIFVGEGQPFLKDEGLQPVEIEMGRISKDGKILTQAYVPVDGLVSVIDGVLQKTRVVTLAHLNRNKKDFIGLFYLDGKGDKREEQLVSDPDRHLKPVSFVPLSNGVKIVLAEMQDIKTTQKDLTSTGVVWIEANGKVRTIKEYLPGIQTNPSSVSKGSDGSLIVTGRVTAEKGNEAGWLLKIGTDGNLIFQRAFSRGLDATLRQGRVLKDGSVIAIGDAIPAGEGDKAAWVIKTDALGNPVWQKFLTGKYGYTAVDMLVMDDGRIQTLWAAAPTSFGGRRFARLVTLSPEGTLLSDESFMEGSNTIPFRLDEDARQRFVLGIAETGFAEEQKSGRDQYITYDNWIMAMPKLPDYHNPCAASKPKLLDDLP